MDDPTSQDLEIRIGFQRGVGDPTRVFRSMAGLIESVQRLDAHLATMIGANVRTSLLLQDIEAASLKSKLRSIVEAVPDEPLHAGEIKKLIGHFLLKGKHKILDWCSERQEIRDRQEVKRLEVDLHDLASHTDIKLLPAYAPIDTPTLLSDIVAVRDALAPLDQRDQATFSSTEGTSRYNPQLVVSEAVIRDIVTRETLSSMGERILKVKKPDYLGTSQWSFRYGGHMIEAKITDLPWLHRFQTNEDQVHPGDSLRVRMREEASYGYDNEIVHMEYEVLEVLEVIRGPRDSQAELLGR